MSILVRGINSSLACSLDGWDTLFFLSWLEDDKVIGDLVHHHGFRSCPDLV